MRAISTSAPARSRSAGTRNNRSRRVGRILSTIEAPPSNGSYRLSPSSSCMPSELVAFACGSRSTIKMRWPRSASAHPRLTAVVVLPTPPFWFAIATIFIFRTGERTQRACWRWWLAIANFVFEQNGARGSTLRRAAATRTRGLSRTGIATAPQSLRSRQFSYAGNNQCAQLESPPAIPLFPKQMIGIGQHLGHFQFTSFRQPALKNFEKKIALEIDEDRFGILIASFRAAAAKGLFGRTNVNVARPIFLRAQSLQSENEIARNAGVIAGREFFASHRPCAPLHNYMSAAQARRMRPKPKLEWMKTERNDPGARERSEVFARSHFANANVAARFIDINFCLGRRD